MIKTINRLILAAGAVVLCLASPFASAHVNFDVNIGISAPPPLPPAQVVAVAPPQGYSSCYVTQGMWYNDVWVPAHRQCEYNGPDGPSVWVSGYWGCPNVGPNGACGHWRWYGHRMVRRDVAYNHPDRFRDHHEGPRYAPGPGPGPGPGYAETPAYYHRGEGHTYSHNGPYYSH